MVLNFLRRTPTPEPVAPTPVSTASVVFDGLTDDYRLIGSMPLEGRLSDALNRRAPLLISKAVRGPLTGVPAFAGAPEIVTVDPYDFSLVFAGLDSLPARTPEELASRKIRKVSHEVVLGVPPFRVHGVIWLYVGVAPEELLTRRFNELFMPMTEAEVWFNGTRIDPRDPSAVLVNHMAIRTVADR